MPRTATTPALPGLRVRRYLSRDLITYEPATEVVLPGLGGSAITAAALSKDNVTEGYLCNDFGIIFAPVLPARFRQRRYPRRRAAPRVAPRVMLSDVV